VLVGVFEQPLRSLDAGIAQPPTALARILDDARGAALDRATLPHQRHHREGERAGGQEHQEAEQERGIVAAEDVEPEVHLRS